MAVLLPARGLWLWAGVSPALCPRSGGHTGDPVTLLEVRCESAGGLVSSCLFLLLIFIASINVESQLGRPLLLALLTQCWGRMSLQRDRNRCSRVLCAVARLGTGAWATISPGLVTRCS